MMKSAENIQAFWDAPSALLGPGLLDRAQFALGEYGTDYATFTGRVLDRLQGWVPRKYFGWSHHNYGDVSQATTTQAPTQTRVALVQYLLQTKGWKTTGERTVWLTEGGRLSSLVSEAEQRTRVAASYGLMQALPDVPIWMNHLIIDPNPSQGVFDCGLKRSNPSNKPVFNTWYSLPAANSPL